MFNLMAIISKITIQKKNKSRYNIFLDSGSGEEYWMSVDEDIIVSFHLRKGLEVNKEDLEKIIYEENVRKAYNKAINFLSFRIRSKKELVDYLTKNEIDEETIQVVIERLTKEKYINDIEFSNAFVRSRIHLTLKGPGFIKKELMDKGIREEYILQSLKIFTYEDQLEKMKKLLEKKRKIRSKSSAHEENQKLITVGLQQGFNIDVIKEALSEINGDLDDQEERDWEGVVYQGEKAMRKYNQLKDWERRQKVKQFLYRRGFSIELIDRFLEEYNEQEE